MNKKLLYESSRLFSVYGYAMSHGLLLLRSGKSNDTPTRVDMLFHDVRAMEIRMWFKGIRIEEVDDPLFLNSQSSNPGEMIEPGNKIYSITSSGWSGFVVAGVLSFTEDDGSLFGPSSLVSDPPVETWCVG